MKTKNILLFVIIYIGILPLIGFFYHLLLEPIYGGVAQYLGFYSFLPDIPMWFLPLVLTLTIEKGGVKTAAFIISGLYILFQLGTSIYYSTQTAVFYGY